MCGRTAETAEEQELQEYVDSLRARYPRDFPPHRRRWNIAPSQQQLVIAEIDGDRQVRSMRWGLVPFWAKDSSIGNKMINARAETVATKPAYREALKRRRGLLLATGFYEWRKNANGTKTPFMIRRAGGGLFTMAALWEQRGPEHLETCTIITTSAAGVMRPLHDRMPVILHEDFAEAWLDARTSADDVQELIAGAGIELEAYPVSQHVNAPANDSEMCSKRDETTE